MAEYIKEISLEVGQKNTYMMIPAKQYDYASRFLLVQLRKDGMPFNLNKTDAAIVIATRSDGTTKAFECEVKDDGRVIVPLPYWTVEIEGDVTAYISVYDVNERKLSTFDFTILVEKANYTEETSVDDHQKDILLQIIANEKTYIANEENRSAAENARRLAETERQKAETARVTAEGDRQTAERARTSTETARVKAEALRDTAETARSDAELLRLAAESERKSAESIRVHAESARLSAERVRGDAEARRISSETARASAELDRAAAEGMRETAEKARGAAEEMRTEAETARHHAEAARKEEFSVWQGAMGKVSAFDKRITNLERRLSDDAFLTDGAVSYRKTVPAHALPYAAVTEIGGMTYASDGVLHDTAVTAIESTGRCLISASDVYGSWADKVTKDGRTCYRFKTNVDHLSAPIAFKANTQYTVRFDVLISRIEGSAPNDWAFIFKYTDGSRDIVGVGVFDKWKTMSKTSAAGKSIQSIGVTVNQYQIWNYIDVDTFLFVEGTEIPEGCKPYFKNTFAVPKEVQALEGYGQGVNASCCNRIVLDPANGVKKFVRNTRTKVFDGTENIQKGSSGTYTYYLVYGGSQNNVISNRLPTVAYSKLPTMVGISNEYDGIYFNLGAEILDGVNYANSVEGVKAYLADIYRAGCPLTVISDRASPVETDVSAYFSDDHFIEVEPGGTLTAVNADGDAVPFTVTYMLKEAEA